MKSDQLKSYTNRITNASRSELVVIIYELIINDLNDSLVSLSNGEREYFDKYLRHSKKLVNELMGTLDYSYKISFELMQLYMSVDKFINDGLFQRNVEKVQGAIDVMELLKIGFEGIVKEDKSGPIMVNTEHIYAGLTYGKGVLNEISIGGNQIKRGFKA